MNLFVLCNGIIINNLQAVVDAFVPEPACRHLKRDVPVDADDVADAGVGVVDGTMIPFVVDHDYSSCAASSAAKSHSH